MSLIHDALKKAQEEKKSTIGSGMVSFQEPLDEGKPKINKRTLILASALLLVIAYFGYTKLFSSKAPSVQAPVPSTSGAPVQGVDDLARLKKSAVDAYNADDLDSAWSSLSTASEIAPDDPEIWNNMGLVARKKGDAAKAREDYEKALELKPEYPEALNNLAVLEMQAGNNAKAKELLESAVKISPAYPEANFHLGLLYDQKGDKVKAVEYYKRFLEVAKNYPSSVVDSIRDHVMEIEP